MLILGISIPLLGLLIGVILQHTHFKWRATPIDWFTLSCLLASDVLIWVRYRYQATSLLIMLMVIVAIFVVIGLAWHRGEILYRVFFKLWWRLLFLPSLIAYFVLVVLQWV